MTLAQCFAAIALVVVSAGAQDAAERLKQGMEAAAHGRTADAISHYQAALRLNPHNAEVQYRLGLLLGQVGDFSAAEAAFKQALALKPDHAEAHYSLGLSYIANPRTKLDWPRAADEFRAAAAARSSYAEAWNMLGVALTNLGEKENAAQALQRALALRPDFPEAHFNLGLALEDVGQHAQALEQYRLAISKRGSYPEAAVALGKLLLAKSEYSGAREALISAVRAKPDMTAAHYALARVLKTVGDEAGSEEALEQSQELSTRRQRSVEAASLSNQALDKAKQGDLKAAIESAQQALKLKPDYAPAHYNLGLLLADSGQFDQAAAELQKAISLMPANANAYLNLARVLRLNGSAAEAAAAIQRACGLAPQNDRIREEAAALKGVAPKETEHLFGANADTPDAHYAFAAHLATKGDAQGAAGELLRALELKPDFTEARSMLASAWQQQGEGQRAKLESRKAALATLPAHELRYTVAADRWDEALPLGNAMLGALVWGNGQPLRISLDRADLWDLRPVPEFHSDEYSFELLRQWKQQGKIADIRRVYEQPYNRPAPTKLPAGRIEITFPGQSFRDAALNLARAESTVRFASGTTVNTFVHAIDPVGLVRISGSAEPQFHLRVPPFSGSISEAAGGGIAAGDLAQLGYPAARQSSGPQFQAYEQQGHGSFRFAVYIGWKREQGVWQAAWSVASSNDGPDPLALARNRAEQALKQGYPALFETHTAWWTAYWAKSSVTLPNRTIERQWYLDQYKFGSAARRNTPPITLQAVWTADNGKLPPWKGDYHHDLNTQLSYWPAYSGNHLEEETGYVDWLWRTRDTGFAWTKRFFKLPGLNVPMTADLNGNQIGGWVQYTHSATTAAWLAHHFYLHWKYSADRTFLETRAYPYLHDAAVFIEAFTAAKDSNGKRTHPLSSSPEINDNRPTAWFDGITNYDLALNRWLMSAAAELASELGRTTDAERWKRVLAELPELSFADDGRLLVAPGHPLEASHRHFSHLMAIHPLGLIDWSHGAGAQKTMRAALTELERLGTSAWCGYSFAWLASMAARARDGERAERALEIFSTAFTLRNSFHANGDQSGKGYSKLTYRPFTLEGNFAAAAGVQEMLMQSHSGVIIVFPAIPAAWRDVSFSSLRAEGAFLVSAVKTGGKVDRIVITAERGGRCVVQSPWTGERLVLELKPGERRVIASSSAR